MLDIAYKYKDAFQKEWQKTLTNPKYKLMYTCTWMKHEHALDDSDWNNIQYVSIFEGRVIGFFEAAVDHPGWMITSVFDFSTAETEKETMEFVEDYQGFYKILLEERHFLRIAFTCIEGSPADILNNRICAMKGVNGKLRKVGIETKSIRLADGKYYNNVRYEIINPEWKI